MWRYIMAAVVVAGLASELPKALDAYHGNQNAASNSDAQHETAALQSKTRDKVSTNPLAGRTARIKMDQRGHFITDARLNGRRVEVLVDTGATAVAINETVARRLGIHLDSADFKYTVNTANGQVKAASAILDSVEIGRVRVTQVRATVVKDKSLSSILLGMSFLKELRRFEVSGKYLVLSQ